MGVPADVVVLATSAGAVLASVVRATATWLRPRGSMTIVVKHGEHSIKLSADNPDQAAKIIETFLSEHSVDREGIGE